MTESPPFPTFDYAITKQGGDLGGTGSPLDRARPLSAPFSCVLWVPCWSHPSPSLVTKLICPTRFTLCYGRPWTGPLTLSNHDSAFIMGSGETLIPAELLAQSFFVLKWVWLAFHDSIGGERSLLHVSQMQ